MSCEGCKYWSEMVAESIGGGPVKALCMRECGANLPHAARMVYMGCEHREIGPALDDPASAYDEDEVNALEEDALRNMGLDDAVDFGLEDVGAK